MCQPHPPMPYVTWVWWSSSTGQRWTSRRPRKLAVAAGCKNASLLLDALGLTSWLGRFRPGDVCFSPDHHQPLILHPIALQWSEQAERASIQQSKNKNCIKGRQIVRRWRSPRLTEYLQTNSSCSAYLSPIYLLTTAKLTFLELQTTHGCRAP